MGQNSDGWTRGAPFALIVADAALPSDPAEFARHFAAQLRRMGLRPETSGDPAMVQLHFGALSFRAARADATTLVDADPVQADITLIAKAMPPDWRASGQCLFFVPACSEQDAAVPGGSAAALREFFKLMVLLIDLFNASHLFWSAAKLWSDARQFRDAVAEMLVSGMPPVLHLVAFRGEKGAGELTVQTRGLSHFTRQEIVATGLVGWTMAQLTKRLARVALDMILNGPIAVERRYRGIDPGEWVHLIPQRAVGDDPALVKVVFNFDPD